MESQKYADSMMGTISTIEIEIIIEHQSSLVMSLMGSSGVGSLHVEILIFAVTSYRD